MEEQTQVGARFNFNKIFEYCLLALIFLVPVIFLPSIYLSLYSVKVAFLASIIVVFLGAFLGSTLSTGIITFPKSKFLIPLALLPIFAIISSFFSGAIAKSIAGNVFDLGTSGSLFILSLLFFVAIFASRGDTNVGIKTIYALVGSSLVVVLHLLLRIFGATVLPESFAVRIPNFLVGGAIDTAIFFGVVIISILSILNTFNLSSKIKYCLYALIVVGMLFVGASGFMPAIVVLGLFSLIYFVYTFSWSVGNHEDSSRKDKASFPSLIVLVITVVLILSGGALSGYLSNIFKINITEVRPNTLTTVTMIGDALKINPIFGVGPNMFKELWDQNKPIDINLTQFWSSEFNFGSGFVPTVAVTTGILGIIALLAFFVMYLRSGFRAIFSSVGDTRMRFVSTTTFFISLFLWVMTVVYVPSISVLALAFMFSGIFAGTLVAQGVVQNVEFNIFRNPKANFASVFIIVVLLISSIAGGYFVWERVVATVVFQKGDPIGALRLVETDMYWRTASEVSLARVSEIVSTVSNAEDLSENQRILIQGAISDSVLSAREAITWNSKNFQNWFALGRVYEILASGGIDGAIENSVSAYNEALLRAPNNPAIPLALARLSALRNDLAGAREFINQSIGMKANYSEAYFTLAQLEVATNNLEGAIRSVESAVLVDPGNPGLLFQLGLLKYNRNDFRGAAMAFEEAIRWVPDYANAKYFLGLSYNELGLTEQAIAVFENLLSTNQDNAEISLILSNLRTGRDPFTGANPPVDSSPETRAELPLED
jgi:cytochrome c-type biogenesis protein CcmH/NrfG